jgi:hypothetical protein
MVSNNVMPLIRTKPTLYDLHLLVCTTCSNHMVSTDSLLKLLAERLCLLLRCLLWYKFPFMVHVPSATACLLHGQLVHEPSRNASADGSNCHNTGSHQAC